MDAVRAVVKDASNTVDWLAYFTSISQQCPWSLAAYKLGQLDIQEWQGNIIPLGTMQARMYVVEDSSDVEALADGIESEGDEWLWSRPGYGPFATPVQVLIQQNAAELARLRKLIGEE
jgi:hypothetical protein